MASRQDRHLQRRGLLSEETSWVTDEASALTALTSGKEQDLQALRIAVAQGRISVELFQKRCDCLFKLIGLFSDIRRSDLVFQSLLLLACLADRARLIPPLRQKLSKHAGAYLHTYLHAYAASDTGFQVVLLSAVSGLAIECPGAVGNLRAQHVHRALVRMLTERLVIEEESLEAHVCCLSALANMCAVSKKVVQDLVEDECWTRVSIYSQKLFAAELRCEELEEAREQLLHLLYMLLPKRSASGDRDVTSVVAAALVWFSGAASCSSSLFLRLSEMLQQFWERSPDADCTEQQLRALSRTALGLALSSSSAALQTLAISFLANLCCRWSGPVTEHLLNGGLTALIATVPHAAREGQLEACRLLCAVVKTGLMQREALDACLSMVWAVICSAAAEMTPGNDERTVAALCLLLSIDRCYGDDVRSLMPDKGYMRPALKTAIGRRHSVEFDLSALAWMVE